MTVALVAMLSTAAGCVSDVDAILGDRRFPGGDAIMLSDNTRLMRSGAGWAAQATGTTANVIEPSEATLSHFVTVNEGLLVFTNVTSWESIEGAPSITLESSLQSGTATYGGSGYSITGLIAGPAFDAIDMLTVTADDGISEPVVVVVDAPTRLGNPASILGTPSGYSTQVRIPDGGFELLYVFVVATDGVGGEDGLMRFVFAEDMVLDDGYRTAPLLDDDGVSAIAQRGLEVSTIYFAYYNMVPSTLFFDGEEVHVQAGRMFEVDFIDLF